MRIEIEEPFQFVVLILGMLSFGCFLYGPLTNRLFLGDILIGLILIIIAFIIILFKVRIYESSKEN